MRVKPTVCGLVPTRRILRLYIFRIQARCLPGELRANEHSRTGRRPRRDREGCTGFCTDCLHPAVTFSYWPFLGRSSEVVRVKGKRLSIKSLQRIQKAIGSDGVSVSSTTSAQAQKTAVEVTAIIAKAADKETDGTNQTDLPQPIELLQAVHSLFTIHSLLGL